MFFETAPIEDSDEMETAADALCDAVEDLARHGELHAGQAECDGDVVCLGYELPWSPGYAASMAGPAEQAGFGDYKDDAVQYAKDDLVNLNNRLSQSGYGIEFDADGLAALADASETEVNIDPEHAVKRARKSEEYVKTTAFCEFRVPVRLVRNLSAVMESESREAAGIKAWAAMAKRVGA